MAGYVREVTVTFELSDGRELECRYGYAVTYGNYSGLPENCYPDECDVSEPEYFLDGKAVELSELPKGLEAIAEAMYEADSSSRKFSYREDDPEGPDYD